MLAVLGAICSHEQAIHGLFLVKCLKRCWKEITSFQ